MHAQECVVATFITHGHLYNTENPPLLKDGDLLIHGHTHEKVMRRTDYYTYINPGSAALPKDDDIHSYMIYEDGVFTIKDFDMKPIMSYEVKNN